MTKLRPLSLYLVIFCFALCKPKIKAAQFPTVDSLYSWINVELEYRTDTSRYFILDQVRSKCASDFDCVYKTYTDLISRFELNLDLFLCFYINQEIINTCERASEQEKLVLGYRNQGRFAASLNDVGIAFSSFEKASEIAAVLNNKELELEVKSYQYYELLKHSPEYTFDKPTVDSLLEEIKLNIGKGAQYGLLGCAIALDYVDQKAYNLAEQYLLQVADIEIPSTQLMVAEIKSDIARGRNNYEKAIQCNKNVIKISKDLNSLWSEINALLNLAELEMTFNNREKALEYLEATSLDNDDSEMVDLKVRYFDLYYTHFKEAGRYPTALYCLEKKLYNEKIWKNRNKGFNAFQFYLEKEKKLNKLERERQRKERHTSYVILILSLLSSGLLATGFFYQQKKKKQLSIQNQKIKDQATRLKNIDQTKSRFFANISHELRTPITLIKGPLNTLVTAPDLSEKSYKLIQLAKENTGNLESLVNSILDLSKIEAGRMTLKEEPIVLYDFSRRIVSNFESHAQRNEIQLRFEYLANDHLNLQLDKDKLETVLNNLLSNAIKFTDKGGVISLNVEDKKKDILISVNDTGRGISNTDLPHVFNRYFQSEMEHTPSEGGTGIGLAFAKELVELMEGNISVQSEVGSGTSFFVELPRKEILGTSMWEEEIVQEKLVHGSGELAYRKLSDVEADDHDTAYMVSNIPIIRKNILLVEDNSSIQDYVRIILEDQFNIELVSNGQEAIEYLNNALDSSDDSFPDLIISDVMMPLMDGFQFIEHIKSDTNLSQIPVIMLTARADLKDKIKALRIGVDDYLYKPFNEEELKVRVENLLRNYDARSISESEQTEEHSIPVFSQEDMKWLAMFEDYILKNYTQQILNIPKIAFDMAMSESSLLRKLKQLTGLSPAKYLQEVRLEKAMTLLVCKAYNSVSRVAVEVGYSDTRSFSRSFKNRFGKSPSDCLRS